MTEKTQLVNDIVGGLKGILIQDKEGVIVPIT